MYNAHQEVLTALVDRNTKQNYSVLFQIKAAV